MNGVHDVVNCDSILALLEKHELLSGAWCGIKFDDLPPHMKANVQQFVLSFLAEVGKSTQEGDK